jgi:predicted PurR-regulated permease PerM
MQFMNNELVPVILVICLAILTIALSIASVYLINVLIEAKRTLRRANAILDDTQDKIQGILNPFHSLSAFASHFTTGLKVVDGFVSLIKDKHDKQEPSSRQDKE